MSLIKRVMVLGWNDKWTVIINRYNIKRPFWSPTWGVRREKHIFKRTAQEWKKNALLQHHVPETALPCWILKESLLTYRDLRAIQTPHFKTLLRRLFRILYYSNKFLYTSYSNTSFRIFTLTEIWSLYRYRIQSRSTGLRSVWAASCFS